MAGPRENSSLHSPDTPKELIKIKPAILMSWLTGPHRSVMKVSFCLISSWLKAASLSWFPSVCQEWHVCCVRWHSCIVAELLGDLGWKRIIKFISAFCKRKKKEKETKLLDLEKCWHLFLLEINHFLVFLSADEHSGSHRTPTKTNLIPSLISHPPGQGQRLERFASFVRNTGIKMRAKGSIRQFSQHWEGPVCQVLVLLINMTIDWS